MDDEMTEINKRKSLSMDDEMTEINRRPKRDEDPPAPSLLWSEWQLLDSILPTGGFAHSFGLEAAMQSRLVLSPTDLRSYTIHLLHNTASLLLPFVRSAAISQSPETWKKLNITLDATLTNEISRKASISQGSALMRVGAAVFSEAPSLGAMRKDLLSSGEVCLHHAAVFGLICGTLGMEGGTAQRAYMYTTLRDILSAATRLNLVGPLGAAVMQHEVVGVAEGLLRRWSDREVEEACQTSPLLDVVQGCHGYLFSRLFCS